MVSTKNIRRHKMLDFFSYPILWLSRFNMVEMIIQIIDIQLYNHISNVTIFSWNFLVVYQGGLCIGVFRYIWALVQNLLFTLYKIVSSRKEKVSDISSGCLMVVFYMNTCMFFFVIRNLLYVRSMCAVLVKSDNAIRTTTTVIRNSDKVIFTIIWKTIKLFKAKARNLAIYFLIA